MIFFVWDGQGTAFILFFMVSVTSTICITLAQSIRFLMTTIIASSRECCISLLLMKARMDEIGGGEKSVIRLLRDSKENPSVVAFKVRV